MSDSSYYQRPAPGMGYYFLSFPRRPHLNEEYESWYWSGQKWNLLLDTDLESGNKPPTDAVKGTPWWDTVGLQLYIYDGERWIISVNSPQAGDGRPISFPTHPMTGAMVQGPRNELWVYNGVKWTQTYRNPVWVSAVPPSNPVDGDLWFGSNL